MASALIDISTAVEYFCGLFFQRVVS